MEILRDIAVRPEPPPAEEFRSIIAAARETLRRENAELRPRDAEDRPGGLIYLDDLTTVVVPDLHARREFLLGVLDMPVDGQPLAELLAAGQAQLVCVGDGVHAEARAAERWQRAFKEFTSLYKRHAAMDEEMAESLGLMEMVMRLKREYPRHVHFLKGNHENILNEEGRGNHPFRKFAYEGQMVKEYVQRFYGDQLLQEYAEFERELPLVAAGRNFLVSHAEPERFFAPEEVIGYRQNDEVVYGLTWTANGGAEEGSVERMLAAYCREPEEARYFGGHRPVEGRYALRAEGRYVQLHNPEETAVALIRPESGIDPERDVFALEKGPPV
jgi:hypothetical protein